MIDTRARAALRGITTYKPGGSLEAVKKQLKRSTVIKLASNENPLGPSPKAVAALKKAAASINRYPDAGCVDLREKLSKKLKVPVESIIVGNGSDELIVLALRAFVDPGDAVVLASPTFLVYEIQSKACGAAITAVPLKSLRYDLNAMRSAIGPHTKLVFIANPDNPTGTYVTKKELDAFLRDLPRETIVMLDEAYFEFATASDYPQSLGIIDQYPVIVTRTFSKAYGLAGLRVGYGIAQPPIIEAMNAVREPFNVNSLAQAAAAAALEDTVFLARTRALVKNGYRDITKTLEALKIRYIPSAANFVLIELGPRASEVAQALLMRGVMVREMSAWKLSGYIRVTIGTPSENRLFLNALKVALRPRR